MNGNVAYSYIVNIITQDWIVLKPQLSLTVRAHGLKLPITIQNHKPRSQYFIYLFKIPENSKKEVLKPDIVA